MLDEEAVASLERRDPPETRQAAQAAQIHPRAFSSSAPAHNIFYTFTQLHPATHEQTT